MITPMRKSYYSTVWQDFALGAPTFQTRYALQTPNFTIDSPPPGQVWTGSLVVTIQDQITVGQNSQNPPSSASASNYLLQSMVWTFYRDGNAEFTWTGLSVPSNIQIFGNEKCIVVGTTINNTETVNKGAPMPDIITATPNNVAYPNRIVAQMTYVGYAGNEGEVDLKVPFVGGPTVTDTATVGTTIRPQALTTATVTAKFNTGATVLLANPSDHPSNVTPQIRLWSASVSLSSASAIVDSSSAAIVTADGNTLLVTSTQHGFSPAGTADNVLVSNIAQDFYGMVVGSPGNSGTSNQFPINLVVTNYGGAPATTASATLVYSLTTTPPRVPGDFPY